MNASGPLQTIVDSLAADIRRDVAIDDRRIRWIVHSPHYGEPDAARLQSILARRVSDEAAEWAFSFGIEDARGPVRLPANEAIGARPRLCIPLRSHDLLLGFLFIVDPDESLSDAQVEQAQAAAGAAADVLYREQRLRELERGRERWLLMHLLADDGAEAEAAARALVDEGFIDARRVAVLVVRADPDARERVRVEVAIGAALDRLRRVVPARGGLELRKPDHGAFLLALDDSASVSARDLAERLLALVDAEGLDVTARIGVGGPHDLAQARRSYREACDAVGVAERVARFGRIATWDELGAYRTLARFPADVADGALHPGLAALLGDPANAALAETLEAYLDLAGDAKATAEALSLHRATLYYRLNRIEEITGARLKTGEDRLALHLGLRLARLSGLR
ncbi:MAG TPA: helix-turn-helix domain-containing protein [Solirubrobacteraceae bacterium]|nr:helix-turn-helix domain-containing protein [Solirubrobacteraceae bacterium]